MEQPTEAQIAAAAKNLVLWKHYVTPKVLNLVCPKDHAAMQNSSSRPIKESGYVVKFISINMMLSLSPHVSHLFLPCEIEVGDWKKELWNLLKRGRMAQDC